MTSGSMPLNRLSLGRLTIDCDRLFQCGKVEGGRIEAGAVELCFSIWAVT